MYAFMVKFSSLVAGTRNFYVTISISESSHFLKFLHGLLQNTRRKRPLYHALERAEGKVPQFQLLVTEVLRNPGFWVGGATPDELERVLLDTLPNLSKDVYLALLRVVLSSSANEPLGVKHLQRLLDAIIGRDDWDLTRSVLQELHTCTKVTIPVKSINRLLQKALKDPDPENFLHVYHTFNTMRLQPNAVTYGIVLLWNSIRPTLKVPSIPKVSDQTFQDFNNILADVTGCSSGDHHHHGVQIKEFLSTGRCKEAWEIFKSLRAQGVALELNVLESLALWVRNIDEFRELITEPVPILEDGFCNVLKSEWARSPTFDMGYFLTAVFRLDNKCTNSFYKDLWVLLNKRADFKVPLIFARVLPSNVRMGLLQSSSQAGNSFITRNIQTLIDNEDFGKAHTILLESLLQSALSVDNNTSLAMSIAQAVFLNGYLPEDLELYKGVVNRAASEGMVRGIIDLLTVIIDVNPCILDEFTWNTAIRSIYDHGQVSEARPLLDKINLTKKISASVKIYANMLLLHSTDELAEFIADELPQLAADSERALSTALGSLTRRQQYTKSYRLLWRVRRINAKSIKVLHYALAMQAAALANDRRSFVGLKEELKRSGHGQLVDTLQKALLGLHQQTIEGTPDVQALGLAICLGVFMEKGISRFTTAFLELFKGPLAPNYDAIRTFLGIQCDHGKDLLGADWGGFFMNWMEECNLPLNTALYAKLLRLSAQRQDSSLASFLVQNLAREGIKFNRTIYKELLRCIQVTGGGSLDAIIRLFSMAKSARIQPDATYYEVLVSLATSEKRYEEAVQWVQASVVDRRRVSTLTVQNLLSVLFTSWPLASFLPISEEFHNLGYLAGKDIYEQFLREALGRRDLSKARYHYNLILQTRHPLCSDDALSMLKLNLENGHVQNAYKVFQVMGNNNQLSKELSSFSQVIDEYLGPAVDKDPTLLSRVPAMRDLQLTGIEELLSFAERKGKFLSPDWCQSALENSLAWGNLNVARRLHLYMVTNVIPFNSDSQDRVTSMWRQQLDVIRGCVKR